MFRCYLGRVITLKHTTLHDTHDAVSIKTYTPHLRNNSAISILAHSSHIPIGSMSGIFTYIWLTFMETVSKYAIHGYYGIYCTIISMCKLMKLDALTGACLMTARCLTSCALSALDALAPKHKSTLAEGKA